MNKREMANELMLRANRLRAQSGSPEFVAEAKLNVAASEALHREADAEEKAKPKVTLKDQVDVVASARCEGFEVQLKAAADTLRRLDDEGGKLLLRLFSSDRDASRASGEFIRSLGVEPKP